MPPIMHYEVRTEVDSGTCYICSEDLDAGNRVAVSVLAETLYGQPCS